MEDMENIHQDEATFRTTLEPEQGIPAQHREGPDHQSGQKPE